MLRYIYYFFILLAFVNCISCSQPEKNPRELPENHTYVDDGREKQANLEYDEDFYDFGTIKHGEAVSYTFSFQNTGNIPLIVKDVIVGCGCTKPKVSKEILYPGEKATMEVVFDSKGWRGVQYKTITINSNGIYSKKSVTIKANIID